MNAHSRCSAFLPALRYRLLTAPLTFLLLASTTRTSVNAAPAPSSCGTVSANCQPNKDCTPPACNVLAQFKTTDEAVCCAACTNRTTCAVWTLHHGGNGNCFLRTAATPPTGGPCTTGVLPKPRPTPPLPPGSKNVLLFAVDDLRPELACYGSLDVHTPHIDALASTAMLFERAYTMVSICAPARQAILTGRRPDTTHNWEINGAEYWRNTLPNAWSLPQFFKEAGYLTIGQGKVRSSLLLRGCVYSLLLLLSCTDTLCCSPSTHAGLSPRRLIRLGRSTVQLVTRRAALLSRERC